MLLPLLLILALSLLTRAAPNCSCYQTSSSTYFTNYVFHDFRNVSLEPIPPFTTQIPADPDYETGEAPQNVGVLQSGYLTTADFNNSWSVMQWGVDSDTIAPVRRWNSLSNVFINKSTGDVNATSKLVLRTKRFTNFQSTAEVENMQKDLLHASIRLRARVSGAAGGVAGMFIYRNDNNESDIEILTRDESDKIRYSNQPVVDPAGNEIQGASTLVNINTDVQVDGTQLNDRSIKRTDGGEGLKWTDWHTHRVDWVEGKSTWFLDGKVVLEKSYGVPSVSCYLVLNMWSDGGEWSGNMTIGEEAQLEIEWVEMVYNTSGPMIARTDKTSRCERVCQVDTGGMDNVVDGGYQTPSGSPGFGGGWATTLLLAGGVFVAVIGMV